MTVDSFILGLVTLRVISGGVEADRGPDVDAVAGGSRSRGCTAAAAGSRSKGCMIAVVVVTVDPLVFWTLRVDSVADSFRGPGGSKGSIIIVIVAVGPCFSWRRVVDSGVDSGDLLGSASAGG